ncbi:MAG: AAA family ATPase [Coriobacteriales bacterium]|nr:AAA family ATPase [Coriobacteriales bacterium]
MDGQLLQLGNNRIVLTFDNDGISEGQLGTLEAQNGCGIEIMFDNGDHYLGEIHDGMLSGKCAMEYASGLRYVGQFDHGKPHGFGTMTYPAHRGSITFEGQWSKGKQTGRGKRVWRDSGGKATQVEIAEWRQGLRDGKGRIKWSDGSSFEGQFSLDQPIGDISFQYADGSHYRGEMAETGDGRYRRQGRGEYVDCDIRTWFGKFDDDKPSGRMRVRDNGGPTYEGEFSGWDPSDDVDYRVTWQDGYSYTGKVDRYWRIEGCGKMWAPDGTQWEGSFIDGQPCGTITVHRPDGSWETGYYMDGKRLYALEIGIAADVASQEGFPYAVREADTPSKQLSSGAHAAAVQKGSVHVGNSDSGGTNSMNCDSSRLASDDRFLHVHYAGNEKYSAELRPYFDGIIGMEDVKGQLDGMYKRFKIDAERQRMLDIAPFEQGFYFIITGNPGTGKTTVARIIGRMLRGMGMLESDAFIEVDRSKLVDGQYYGATAERMNAAIEAARGGTLFIDEAYTLFKKSDDRDLGAEAIETLMKDMEDHRGEYCCIMAGYRDRMSEMMRGVNPGLSSRFNRQVHIEDYTSDELVDILVSMASSRHFYIRTDARPVILSRIELEKVDETFDNARFARRLLDESIERQALRLSGDIGGITTEDLQTLISSDFGEVEEDLSTLEDCMDELNDLIGLAPVKDEVKGFVNNVRVQKEFERRGLTTVQNSFSLNMVFTGNPGTGKTTVARMLSRIYYHLGLLKRPDVFVECVRADLVGRYQGETALKVKEVVKRSLGGILFIDEAYSLVSGEGDSFGREAVDMLVSEIENNRANLAVILAGYTAEMQEFLDSNSGLRSRLPNILEFPDYSLDELEQIFVRDLERRGYSVLASSAVIREAIEAKMHGRDFGNARGVRNICDRVIGAHNARLAVSDFSVTRDEDLVSIIDIDVDPEGRSSNAHDDRMANRSSQELEYDSVVPNGGWGPGRELFTMDTPPMHASFNSIKDDPTIGDQRLFMKARPVNSTSKHRASLQVVPGERYRFHISYMNDAVPSAGDEGAARDVRFSASFPGVLGAFEWKYANAIIKSTTTLPVKIWGQCAVWASEPVTLRYVPGSAELHNGRHRGKGLKLDERLLFSAEGIPIGYEGLDGVIPCSDEGCSGYVTFAVAAERKYAD